MRNRDQDWAEAKRLCRLSGEELRMARELGLNPRKLIGNVPSPSQRWKAPVGVWVRELYRKAHPDASTERPRSLPFPRPPSRPAPLDPVEELEALDEVEDREALDEASLDDDEWAEPEVSLEGEIAEEDRRLRQRQEKFRAAADFVAVAFARLPFVERVVLFGSVARPLRREVPRFRRYRRAGVALWHECQDVDLAVWLTDLSSLKKLQKARASALNDLVAPTESGVAHHQVDIFLFEPGTDRYLGRLCGFGTCPKGKPECLVPGCGATLFLRQHEGFVLDPRSLEPARCVRLFDRAASVGPPSLERGEDDVPS